MSPPEKALSSSVSRTINVAARAWHGDKAGHKLRAFVDFVLAQYVVQGEQELGRDKLSTLLALKYHSVSDAAAELGGIEVIRNTFVGFQPRLFEGPPV